MKMSKLKGRNKLSCNTLVQTRRHQECIHARILPSVFIASMTKGKFHLSPPSVIPTDLRGVY